MYLRSLLSLVISAVAAFSEPETPELFDAEIVPGKYIITLKGDAKPSHIESHLSWVDDVHARSLTKRDEKGIDKIWRNNFKGYSGEFDEETIASISANEDVVAVEPVTIVRPAASSNNPNIIRQKPAPWGLGSISHRTPYWDEYVYDSSAGEGTWAYVVDTGIYAEHDEFGNRVHLGYNAVEGTEFVDEDGHGTLCAGIIAGKTYGVAKKAQLIAVKVFLGDSTTADVAIDGFEWAVSNISATPGRAAKSVVSLALSTLYSEALNTALRTAYHEHNVLSVVSAGSWGYRASLFSPASEETAITVAAIEPNNYRPFFSNWGPAIDIFAPGTNILSAYIGSRNATKDDKSGTSLASSHVAGLVLYLRALESGLDSAKAMTDRTMELATKGVVGNTEHAPNLLAFNGVKTCGYKPT